MNDGPIKKLGDLLIEQRLITKAILNKALEHKKRKIFPGKILVDSGYLSQEDLRNTLAKQFGSIYINPKTFALRNVDLLNFISEEVPGNLYVFPLKRPRRS